MRLDQLRDDRQIDWAVGGGTLFPARRRQEGGDRGREESYASSSLPRRCSMKSDAFAQATNARVLNRSAADLVRVDPRQHHLFKSGDCPSELDPGSRGPRTTRFSKSGIHRVRRSLRRRRCYRVLPRAGGRECKQARTGCVSVEGAKKRKRVSRRERNRCERGCQLDKLGVTGSRPVPPIHALSVLQPKVLQARG